MNKLILASCILAGTLLLGACNENSKQSASEGDSVAAAAPTEAVANPASEEASAPSAERNEDGTPVIPSNGLPTVVDFSAVWCGPCQHMKPIFAELEEAYDGMVNFVTVDIDEYPSYATSCGIQGVPTFVFLDKNGKEVNRAVGAMPRAELEQEINNLMK